MTTNRNAEAEEAAEDAAFEAAFAETTGQTQTATAAEPQETPAEPAATPAEPPATEASGDKGSTSEGATTEDPPVDPFAGLPPQVREILARVPQLEATLEQTKRVAGMVPALQSQIAKLTQHRPDGGESPASEQRPAARKRLDSVEALRGEVPEVAAALDDILAELEARKGAEPAQQTTAAEKPPAADATDEEEAALDSIRPTWADDMASNDFRLWLATQPEEYRRRVMSTSRAGTVLEALSKFDKSRPTAQTTAQNTTNTTRQARMQAAVVPIGDGRGARPRTSAPEDVEEAAFASAFYERTGRRA